MALNSVNLTNMEPLYENLNGEKFTSAEIEEMEVRADIQAERDAEAANEE